MEPAKKSKEGWPSMVPEEFSARLCALPDLDDVVRVVKNMFFAGDKLPDGLYGSPNGEMFHVVRGVVRSRSPCGP